MDAALYQIVLTVWLKVHPLTFTLSKIYPVDTCTATIKNLFEHVKPGVRMKIECVPTNKRDA